MISKLAQVMLYVDDQRTSANFWIDIMGFKIISEEMDDPEMRWIEIAPESDSETTIVLQDKKAIAKQAPELNLGTPSLMFYTEDLDSLHKKLNESGVFVGEIEEFSSYNERVFNFSDKEDHYFAVFEKRS